MVKEGPPYTGQPLSAEERAEIEQAARESTEQLDTLRKEAESAGLSLESDEWKNVINAYRGVQKSLNAYLEVRRDKTKRYQSLINAYYKHLDIFNAARETVMEKLKTPSGAATGSNAEEIKQQRAKLETINLKERRTEGGSMDHDRNEKDALALEEEIRELERGELTRKAEEARKEEILEIRKRLNTINEKERRTKGGSWDHDKHEKDTLELEERIRDLEDGGRKKKVSKAETADEVQKSNDSEDVISTVEAPAQEKMDRSAASPLEVLDEELRALFDRYSEATFAERGPLKRKMDKLMILRDKLLNLSPRAEGYGQISEFTGNQNSLDAIEQLQDSVIEERPELTEKVEAPKPPRNPMEPDADGKPIVMLNSVLTRQAMGAEKRTKKNAEKMKKFGTFPVDPRYEGSISGTPVATAVEKQTMRTERLAKKEKEGRKRNWLLGGGAGVIGAAGLLALFNPWGKKEETAAVKQPERPAAARTAKEKEGRKRNWLLGGGAGVIGAAGLLAFFNPWSKKGETIAIKQPERPAAARTAKDAGLKTPPVSKAGTASPSVTIPAKPETAKVSAAKVEAPKFGAPVNVKVQETIKKEVEAGNLREADAKMVMEWEHMAYQKAGEALPPGSDKRIVSVVKTIRANRNNPYAFKPQVPRTKVEASRAEEAAPARVERPQSPSPEVTSEQGSSVQMFNYGPKGKEVPLFVSTNRTAFDLAQTRAESQPEGAVVRFEYVSTDPATNASETIRGAFLSLGNGKVSPLFQDPDTGGPFAALDPTKMSPAQGADEAAGGR